MNHKSMRRKRRKNRRRQYLLLSGIFLLFALSVSSLLWSGFGEAAKKGVMEGTPFGITQDGIEEVAENGKSALETEGKDNSPQSETEGKDNSPQSEAEGNHNSLQSETKGNHNGIQDAGTEPMWNLMLVNAGNPIPDNYDVNLVEVEGGERVDERIYDSLMEMLDAAREGNLGELPMVVSGYRTQEKQQSLYDDKIAKFKKEGYSDSEAVELAGQWVALPGYSEHQLGFAVDINGAVYDVYSWLQENSYKYGFIFRYPGGKTDITGVAEEVWHYRYVGKEAAKEIYERGICLEEYLDGQK